MHGKWKIAHQRAGGETFIRVCRVRDTSEVVHCGNLEYCPGIFATDAEAEAMARKLNEEEEGKGCEGSK